MNYSQTNKLSPNEVNELVLHTENGDDLSPDLDEKMYNHFMEEMPYGTAKARTGDPHEWIFNRLEQMGEDEIRATFQK